MTFDLTLLSDPQVVAINRLDPHSDHRWFASLQEQRGGRSSYEQSLDGTWKFHYSRNPLGVPQGFEKLDYDTSTWDDIRVPAHIQMEGYDRNQYVNTQYPWDGQEELEVPQVPMRFNPTACYVKNFSLDRTPEPGERVTITFNGAESAIALWLNGTFVGYAEDSFTPSEFDITELLVEGENKLAAEVFKWCSASWLEDQDFFRFSGIFRDVILRTYPATHVRDIHVGVDVADDLASADIKIDADVEGEGSVVVWLGGHALDVDEDGKFVVTLTDPHLWSAEDPYLYEAQVEVSNDEGVVLEYIPLKIGVRRFGIEDGLMKINGERIVFFGVNRHEFGLQGRVMTREETEADMVALKQAGLNAIRTSHYPNNSFFYELADQYGFYVIDEMNLESHGLWDKVRFGELPVETATPGDNPIWLPSLFDRAANMYERDKNHPSIVIWSCGNESFGGTDILAVSNYFRDVDSRPVHYEGVHWDPRYPETTDMYSQMYTPAEDVEEFLKEHRDKPFILCEYAHAMGNSFGAVDRYMDLADRDPLYQGGFIWDFADQAILMSDRYGKQYFGYGGDSSEAPYDNEFCGNGIFFADHSPTPRMQEVKYLHQGIRGTVTPSEITITNRYNFTNTDAFDCVVTVSSEGEVVEEAGLETSVAPGETKVYEVPVAIPNEPGEYTVDVSLRLRSDEPWAPAGFEVAAEQGVIEVEGAPEPVRPPAPTVVEGIHNYGVYGENFSVSFSRLYGGIQSYRYGLTGDGGRDLLKTVPVPNFWHAPTSNERGWGAPAEDGQWLLASRYAKSTWTEDNPTLEERDDMAVVTYKYALPTIPASECVVEYAVDGVGHIDVTMTLKPGEGLGDLPEFGMLFTADADLSELKWYGEGPDESYSDRRGGARLGVYEQKVADQLTPYLRPQEAGNHTGVRWAEVTDERGRGLRFDTDAPMDFSALHWSPFEIENAAHHNELPPIINTVIRPALARRGVAGDNTWGARPHEEYLIPAEEMVFKFGFVGLL